MNSPSTDRSDKPFLTVGDQYPRQDYVNAAYKVANQREGFWQRSATFSTPHGLLRLEWGRFGWDHLWLEDPTPLDLGLIRE
jgi:hypothetical protein